MVVNMVSARLSHKAIHMLFSPIASPPLKRQNGYYSQYNPFPLDFPKIALQISKSLTFIVDSDNLHPVVAAD